MSDQRLIISHLTLRRTIGLLGMTHPLILMLGGYLVFGIGVQNSMSSYYHTGMRDIFVSITISTGLFLFAYKGYDKNEDRLGDIAFILTLGIALFPETPKVGSPSSVQLLAGIIHVISAVCFLLLLAYFCFFLFTKSSTNELSEKKKTRNNIYRASAYVIVTALLLMAVFLFAFDDELHQSLLYYKPIFWLEALCLFAFGVSWWVKGEAILKDSGVSE